MAKSVLIKQVKGTQQVAAAQKEILKALGVRGVGSAIYRKDTRSLRGMLNRVQHLIEAEQVEASKTRRPAKSPSLKGYKIG